MPPDATASYFSAGADNPIFDLTLRSGVSSNWIWYFSAIAILGLIWASFTDLYRGRMLPDIVPLVIGVGGLAAAPFIFDRPWLNVACGAAVALLFGLGVLFGWVGLGDVKYYVAIALATGLVGIAVILLAHVYAAVVGGGVALAKRNRKLEVPMAPFIAMAAITALYMVDGPVWMAATLLGVFALSVTWGLLEARRFPVPTLEEACAPLADGSADRIRVRTASRPAWRDADGEWHEAESGRRITSGMIDKMIHALRLEGDEQQAFYGADTVVIAREVSGQDLAIRLDAGMYHRVTLRAVAATDRAALEE